MVRAYNAGMALNHNYLIPVVSWLDLSTLSQLREEGEPELLEELITVDAVGCFEGEDDYEEESSEEEEDGVAAGQVSGPSGWWEVPLMMQDYSKE